MKLQSIFGLTMGATVLVLALGESSAMAAGSPSYCRAGLVPPVECTGRNAIGYTSGVGQGVSLVDQIWSSAAVDQNPDNWEVLTNQVTATIPTTVATVYQMTWNDYLKCRTQGLLDGSVCRMNEIDPVPGCQLDGADWGKMSAAIYCELSQVLGGLADIVPWFIRTPPGICGERFEYYCDNVYRYGATSGATSLNADVSDFLVTRGVDPASFLLPDTCSPYTIAPFETVFDHSIYVDCAYIIP